MNKQLKKSQLNSNIRKFYLFSALGTSVGLALPVIVLFWQDNGLSLTEVMILQSAMSFILIFLEVPSGYLADIIGRKKAFIWGATFFLISMIIYVFGHTFSAFLLAEVAFGIGLSLLSGADAAFIYDTLKELKREKEYQKIWGRNVFYRLGATGVFSLVGGYIASFGLRYTWVAALVPATLMVLMSFSLREPKRHKLIYRRGHVKTLLKIIQKSILKKARLKWFMLYTGLIFMFYHGAYWLYQPLFEMMGVEIAYYGIIFAAFYLVSALASNYAYVLEAFFGRRTMLVSLAVLTGLGLVLMSRVLFMFTFSFIFIHAFVRGIYTVVVSDYINQLTHSSMRATVLSVQNLIARFLFALAVPLLGVMADVYTVPQALGIMGLTVFAVGGALLFMFQGYANHLSLFGRDRGNR